MILWYGAMFALCTSGTTLAYRGPLSSKAWRCWHGSGAWKVDVLRAVVTLLLATFVLWNLEEQSLRNTSSRLQLRPYEKILLSSILILLLITNFLVFPSVFIEGIKARIAAGTWPPCCPTLSELTFRQIRLPYFPYFLYVAGLYAGLIFPVLIFLIRHGKKDWQELREARSTFYESSETTAQTCPLSLGYQELALRFQNYVIKIKGLAVRFVPVILAVSLGFLYERLTGSKGTVTDTASEFGKVALWLLLGPSLLICVTIVALGYQKAVYTAEAGLQAVIQAAVVSPDREALLEKILNARGELLWKQSPAAFVLTVVGSASVSIPLSIARTGYILKTVVGANGWLEVFIPTQVIEFFAGFYMRVTESKGALSVEILSGAASEATKNRMKAKNYYRNHRRTLVSELA